MTLKLKVYFAFLLAFIVGATFLYLKNQTEDLLNTHADTLHKLTDIEMYDQQLNEEVLNAAFRLYETYDTLNQALDNMHRTTDELNSFLASKDANYQDMREKLTAFQNALQEKERHVQRFITLNALIKNSTSHIPSLTARYMNKFGDRNNSYLLTISAITSSIFLARNALDADMLSGIEVHLETLRNSEFDDPEQTEFNRVFLSHVEVFYRYLPYYQPTFQKILSSPTRIILHDIQEEYVSLSGHEADNLSTISFAITFAFIGSLILIVYFLFSIESNRRDVIELHQQLEGQATRDQLTHLGNRFAFERQEKTLEAGTSMILLNIDGFKNINDFYGREVGDAVLCHVGEMMKRILSKELEIDVYRVGADDFGVLVPPSSNIELHDLADSIIQHIESAPFRFSDYSVPLRISIGLSHTPPLLETADLALKRVKYTRDKFLTYSKRLGLEANAEVNLNTLGIITDAIRRDAVAPYFMPLMRVSDNKIFGYECLIRIHAEDGSIIPPNDFLSVAKSGRLYGQLTKIMLKKSIRQFLNSEYSFSINFSIEDIMDSSVTSLLFELLDENPEMGKRLTLEILESEGVDNYEQLQGFILRLKQFGCKVAIDDYGTGYSNLQHLVQLDVDSLKIDAALIKELVTDANTRVAVKAITEMARDLSIPSTTAEFVASAELLEAVAATGITNAQGYYIGTPSPELREIPAFMDN